MGVLTVHRMLNVKQLRVLSYRTNCFYWIYWAIHKSKESFIILEVMEILPQLHFLFKSLKCVLISLQKIWGGGGGYRYLMRNLEETKKIAEKGWLMSLVSHRYSRLYIRDNYDKRLCDHWQDLNTTQKHFLPVAFSGRNIVINGHRCGVPSACSERSETINVTWTMTRNPKAFQGNGLKA